MDSAALDLNCGNKLHTAHCRVQRKDSYIPGRNYANTSPSEIQLAMSVLAHFGKGS